MKYIGSSYTMNRVRNKIKEKLWYKFSEIKPEIWDKISPLQVDNRMFIRVEDKVLRELL